jgi:hypothetical protein
MDNIYINNALAFVAVCSGAIGTAYVGVKAFYIARNVADPPNIGRFEQAVFGQEIMDRDIEDFFGVRRNDIEEAINSVNNLAKKVVSNFLLGNQYGGGKSEDDINKFKDEYNKLPQKIKDIVEQIKNKLKSLCGTSGGMKKQKTKRIKTKRRRHTKRKM